MNCSNCGMYVPENNYRCPHCNTVAKTGLNPSDFKRQAARRSAFNPNVLFMALLMIGVAILAFIMISRGGGTSDDSLSNTNAAFDRTNNERMTAGGSTENNGNDNYGDTGDSDIDGTVGELDLGYIVNRQNPGEMMQISEFIQGDQITIFDFYSDYCGPCRRISPWLKQLDKKRDDIVVFKVNINRPSVRGIDWKSPLAQQYNLRSIPHFKIYNSDGELDVEGKQASIRVEQLLRSEGIIR